MNNISTSILYGMHFFIYAKTVATVNVTHRWRGCSLHPIVLCVLSWWRHQMETFSALLAICAGYSPVPGKFPTQRPVTRSFDVYFDLHPNKRLSKQSCGWWFETPSRPLWRHRNKFTCPELNTASNSCLTKQESRNLYRDKCSNRSKFAVFFFHPITVNDINSHAYIYSLIACIGVIWSSPTVILSACPIRS